MSVTAVNPVTALPQATPGTTAATDPAIAVTTPVAAAPTPTATMAGDTSDVQGSTGDPSSASLPDSSSSIPNEKITGGHVTSVGDPHETTGDGFKFDNMKTGNFVKMRAKTGDFELQTRQDPWDRNPQATVNTAAAVKVNGGGDVVKYDAKTNALTFNGKPIEVKNGQPFEIPGGGKIEKSAEGYNITSAAGDSVSIFDRGTYMDVSAEASPDRVDGDIAGSLGRLDSDTDMTNDFEGRDGQAMDVNNTDAFIEAWRVKEGEDLIGDAEVKGGGAEPALPEAPPVIEGQAAVAGKEDEATTKLKGIKDELAKLKADPANAGFAELLAKLEELLGGAEKGEEEPKAALEQQVNDAKPEGNVGIEALLRMILEWLAVQKKQEEIRQTAKEAEKEQVAPLPVAA